MKRRDVREGALDTKLCDWPAVKSGRVFPLCGSRHKERYWIMLSKPASTITFSKKKKSDGLLKKLPETIIRYEIKPIKSKEIFSLKIQIVQKKSAGNWGTLR